MRKLGKLSLIAITLALTVSMVFPPASSAKLIKKVDNIIVMLDQSGSMSLDYADTSQKKIDVAVDMISRFDKAVPELDYTSGMFLFSPFEEVSPLATYQNGVFSSAADSVDTNFGLSSRPTTLGDGLKAIAPKIDELSGRTGLIIFTDGDSNMGADPVTQAQMLYDNFSPNLDIHMVSLADSEAGSVGIHQIKALSDSSVSADVNSLATNAGMAKFVSNILYEEVADSVPVAAPVAAEVITFNLLFGFDKADITDEMIPVLEQVQLILEEDLDAGFILAGHTDSSGAEGYNLGLSERRAAAVGAWLTDNGVSAERLDVVGYGETQPKFDNSTEDGRTLNRRVEVVGK